MRAALCSLGVLGLLLLAGSIRAAEPAITPVAIQLASAAYPQALPNDGRAEATITVSATTPAGAPAPGVQFAATVSSGGGMLRERSAVTDASGQASFQFRMGVAPRPAVIEVRDLATGTTQQLTIPLAAVSYLDLLLVTPEEYAAHKRRQASAAPIYKLALDVFPQQLAADGGSSSHITATLTFTADGRPAPGVPLKADIAGSSSRIHTTQKATDSGGRMSFYFTAGRTPGTATVRISEPSTGLTTSASILLVEAGPARIELLVADTAALGTDHDGTLLPADGFTTLPLKIKVTDLYGSALAGVEVKLEVVDLGCGWIELRTPVSDAFGETSAVYHAGAVTGKLRLRAFACSGLPYP
jgi:hypothetical protein